jgi:alkanesulfonate monooxygenase SsuD/methylene tetrahydromethanopterin reductase-like flavin-dependent oxidoreductase (luciferase family)
MAAGVEAVVDAAGASREPDLPAAAEQLAREVTLTGTYDEARAAIATWSAAGADTISLVLPPGRPEAELAELVDVVAEAVRGKRHTPVVVAA